MADGELFAGLPEQAAPRSGLAGRGAPRLRQPDRAQMALRVVNVDSLIGQDHPVRVIWRYVEELDLSALEDRIKARTHNVGHPATAPRLLLALWLYATSEGVGSARALAALCESHDVYRWLCGGVSVNHHTLADFRVDHADLLDQLLVKHLAALAAAKLIDLDALTQDGVRIRASAGAASFRRGATLDRHQVMAQAVVEELKREVAANADASNARIRAAKARAVRESGERLAAAQKALEAIEQQRKAREQKHKNGKQPTEPRASTTDAEARVMKMADGGFRPAYNVQVASAAGEQIVVAVDVTNNGSDRGLLRPMLEQWRKRSGRLPQRHLADGGFSSAEDLEWAHAEGIEVYCPPTQSKYGTDPCQPRRGDGKGVLAWRERMASEAGKQPYKERSKCECIHARWRNWGLRQLPVRGVQKVRAVLLLFALTNNILQGHRLAIAQAQIKSA